MSASLRRARPGDRPGIAALLEHAGLPTHELDRWLPHYVVAEAAGALIGVAGLEVHGRDGVLRSVAVSPDWRGVGLGNRLAARVIASAQQAGLHRLYLLTTTAEDFFAGHGFRRIPRRDASEAVRASVEFREACPDSAVAMVLDLSTG